MFGALDIFPSGLESKDLHMTKSHFELWNGSFPVEICRLFLVLSEKPVTSMFPGYERVMQKLRPEACAGAHPGRAFALHPGVWGL